MLGMVYTIYLFATVIVIFHAAVSKEFVDYEDDCRCVTSCFCSNHFCTPPRFPDFLGFFRSSLRNFPNLANITRDLSTKLIKRDCFKFAPLLRTDWTDFDRLVCSSLQSALEADVLLRMAVDETCSGLDLDTSDQDSHVSMNLQHAGLDFNIDNKKRRGGRENDDDNDDNRDDDDDDDDGGGGDDDDYRRNSLEDEMAPRIYGYKLVGMNFKINNSAKNRNRESSSHDDDPGKDGDDGDDDDDDDGFEATYDENGRGLDDGGRTLMRSQGGGVTLTKQDISLVVIFASILLSIILLSVIFCRIRKKKLAAIPKEDIPTKKLASHPWYNGTSSFQEKETSFIEDRLTRNYKTHPVKRYL